MTVSFGGFVGLFFLGGCCVTRGLFFAIIGTILIALFIVFGMPWLKSVFIGGSLQVNIEIHSAEDDYDVEYQGKSVSRTVVGMSIDFPMGSAPDSSADLKFKDANGKELEVLWSQPDKNDNDEKQTTRWTFREVYLPIGFREGMLCSKYRDLKWLRLSEVGVKSVQAQ